VSRRPEDGSGGSLNLKLLGAEGANGRAGFVSG
jgi:hypothetical protein